LVSLLEERERALRERVFERERECAQRERERECTHRERERERETERTRSEWGRERNRESALTKRERGGRGERERARSERETERTDGVGLVREEATVLFRIETVRYGNRRTLNRSIREQVHSSSEGRYVRTGRRLLSEGGGKQILMIDPRNASLA
jgi:hypothetical protein